MKYTSTIDQKIASVIWRYHNRTWALPKARPGETQRWCLGCGRITWHRIEDNKCLARKHTTYAKTCYKCEQSIETLSKSVYSYWLKHHKCMVAGDHAYACPDCEYKTMDGGYKARKRYEKHRRKHLVLGGKTLCRELGAGES